MIKNNIALLLHPSLRGRAFIQALIKRNLIPSEVVLMNGPCLNIKQISDNDIFYYKPLEKPEDTLVDIDIPITLIDSDNCNSKESINALKNLKSEWVIYSGGGILKSEVLSIGKKFIHIHPGKLPDYRGSTCFYYSLLDNGFCSCTAFIMDENLDSGKIIYQKDFHPPPKVDFDNIFDPWMRADTLCDLLENNDFECDIRLYNNDLSKSTMYYIIHPVLKHLAIIKNNNEV